MRQGFYKIVFHHIFLGITAMLMMKQTLVMDAVSNFDPLKYLIVFLSTIIIYQTASSGIRFPFTPTRVHRNKFWIVIMIVASLVLISIIFKTLSHREIFLLLCLLISCFAYFISIGTWQGLRALPGVKGTMLAFAWAMVTVAFPLINQWKGSTDFNLLLQRFLFMLAICIIYNLRDVDADRKHGVVTIASIAGEGKTKMISGFCLLLFVISFLLHEHKNYSITPLIWSAAITAVAISKAKINGNVFYYRYIIDGCMMLQSILVMGFAI